MITWTFFLAIIWLVTSAFNEYRSAQELGVRALLTEQRAFLARELHDTISHELTRITMSTQQLQLRGHIVPEDLDQILERSDQALLELRAVMDLLRDGEGNEEQSPRSWQAPVDRMTTSLREAGFTVTSDIDPGPLPAPVLSASLRVLAEATHNVSKHATTSCPVSVLVRQESTHLRITVTNGLGARRAQATHVGRGVQGMTERVQQLGGTLTAGPGTGQDAGMWTVTALLPLRPGDLSEPAHEVI